MISLQKSRFVDLMGALALLPYFLCSDQGSIWVRARDFLKSRSRVFSIPPSKSIVWEDPKGSQTHEAFIPGLCLFRVELVRPVVSAIASSHVDNVKITMCLFILPRGSNNAPYVFTLLAQTRLCSISHATLLSFSFHDADTEDYDVSRSQIRHQASWLDVSRIE